MTTTTTPHPQVPRPAGAVRVFPWEPPEVTGLPDVWRYFDGTLRVVERDGPDDIEVQLQGEQWASGTVKREIVVHQLHRDEAITVEQARRLAAALVAACDEADQMHGYDRIEVTR